MECGSDFWPVNVEYETYGTLSKDKDNAVLICHALSGDAHAAGWDAKAEEEGRTWRSDRPGWWDPVIGPGKPLDTNQYFVICSNVLGSCYGTTGPPSVDPETEKPYGLDFPVVTVGDWVNLQERLIDRLGIDKLLCVMGGSLGGQQALEWSLRFPDRLRAAAIIAASHKLSDMGLAYNAVGRYAIMRDPRFNEGSYYGKEGPEIGLSVARRLAHITYLSEESMDDKFGRKYKEGQGPSFHFGPEFEVESYLDHQGASFVRRFDANSYIYITRAMDYYDAARHAGGNLEKALAKAKCRYLLTSFSSDLLYPAEQMRELAVATVRAGKQVSYLDIPSKAGHDAFLEDEKLGLAVGLFLKGVRGC